MLNILDVSVVITARGHNPTILHPSFLEAQGIVEKEWELSEPPLCTPAIATVAYKNGVRFLAEEQKLQIGQGTLECKPEDSVVSDLTLKYVQTLPHVAYGAVGMNFDGFIDRAGPIDFLKKKFVSDQKWTESLPPLDVGFRFSFDGEPGKLVVNFDGRTIEVQGEKRVGILLRANFHKELEDKSKEELASILALYPERLTRLSSVIDTIFEDVADE